MPVNIKLTNRVAIEIALSTLPTNKSFTVDSATFSADEVKAKLEAMLTAYEKKAATPKKPTKTQQENEPVKQAIVALLKDSPSPLTASDVAASVGVSVQKASALLSQLVTAGLAQRVPEKRKTYFTHA